MWAQSRPRPRGTVDSTSDGQASQHGASLILSQSFPRRFTKMPYKSQAQAGYFHTHEKQLASQGVDVGEWDAATKGKKLPRRAVSSKLVSAKKSKDGK